MSRATSPLKVGILQTDSVLEEYQPRFGDYPDMFAALLEDAARAIGQPLELSSYDARNGSLPAAPDECHGYVITGSRHSVYEELDWIAGLARFLGDVLGTDSRIVGICFGHQLMAHFFGGRTEAASVGWGVGVHETQLEGREPWMHPLRDAVGLLSSHKDQVTELPPGARPFAASSHCPVAGFVMGQQVMTLQGHPEFTKPYAEALIRRREALLGPTTFAAGLRSLEQPTHEADVAQWMLRFIGGSALHGEAHKVKVTED